MAERRMFAKTIVDSDAFLDMPTSAQALYFHLGMRADDDGFINNPKKIQLFVRASDDDLKLLFVKKFVIHFESGIVVIKHWKIHNYIAKDRYTETKYKTEKSMLRYDENNAYQLPEDVEIPTMYTTCIQIDDTGKDRLGKDRLGKDRLGKVNTMSGNPTAQTINETIKEVVQFLNEKTGCHYKPSSKATQQHIHARLMDGFTLDDFKVVIEKKTAEWKGTELERFLRPETLFGTKFESYLNQRITKKSSNPFLAMLEEEDEQEGGGGSTGLPCDNIPKRIQG